MTEFSCDKPDEHCDLHACQLAYKERKAEVDRMFENPRFLCLNCGARVHDEGNVCRPRAI